MRPARPRAQGRWLLEACLRQLGDRIAAPLLQLLPQSSRGDACQALRVAFARGGRWLARGLAGQGAQLSRRRARGCAPGRCDSSASCAPFRAAPPRTRPRRSGGWPRRTAWRPRARPGGPRRAGPMPRRQDRVRHDEPIRALRAEQLARLGQEHAVRRKRVHAQRASLAAGRHRAHQRRAGADQVVHEHRMPALDRSHDEVAAGDHAAAAALVDDREADVAPRARLEQLLQALRTLRSANVRRHDADGRVGGQPGEVGAPSAAPPRGDRPGTGRRSRRPRGCARRARARDPCRPPRRAAPRSAA